MDKVGVVLGIGPCEGEVFEHRRRSADQSSANRVSRSR